MSPQKKKIKFHQKSTRLKFFIWKYNVRFDTLSLIETFKTFKEEFKIIFVITLIKILELTTCYQKFEKVKTQYGFIK